jgi:hypothetical protein
MSSRIRSAYNRRPRGSSTGADIAVGAIVVALIIAIIAAVVLLSGLITLLAWNVGVVGIAAALGATVGKISLGIAICANFAIGIIGRIFHGPSTVKTDS